MDLLNMHHLYHLTKSSTNITETASSYLDLMITPSPQTVPCAYITNAVSKNKPFKRTIYNYNKIDSDKFCNLLINVESTENSVYNLVQ